MAIRRLAILIFTTISIGSLVACGGSADTSPTATVMVVETPSSATIPATAVADGDATVPGTATSSPSVGLATATDSAAEYQLVSRSDSASDPIPTPDLEQKQREMQPTAVIIDGEYPYPTANAAIDSDGDGFYEISELDQAVRETFPFYEWPEAYTPTVDDIFEMMDFDRIPPGARFEVPMELQVLGSLNQCAWQQNWLDAFRAGDQDTMDRSMQHLRTTVLTNPVNVHIISNETEILNEAELGDPARLIRDIDLNCVGFNQWVESQGSNRLPIHTLRLLLPDSNTARY